MSELVREALRHYERQRWWEQTNAYGRAQAQALGIREEDVKPAMLTTQSAFSPKSRAR